MAAAEQPAGEPPPPPPPAPQAPAAEGTGTGLVSQRSVPTPFLTKTYQLVDDPAVDDIISWNDDGSAFVVWRPAEFARDLLPKYFKHNNFSSFVRQLNTYGFRKIVPDRWEFANDCFKRGEKRLLCDIHRRKVTPAAAAAAPTAGVVTVAAAAIPMALPVPVVGSPVYSGEEQVLSSSSSPEPSQAQAPSGGSGSGASGDAAADENDRLRRENARLARELGQMKKLCNNILLLMSRYAATQQLDGVKAVAASGNCSGESVDAAPPPAPPPPSILELMPSSCPGGAPPAYADVEHDADADEEDKMSARLFGVSIGRKRMRGGVGGGGGGGGDSDSGSGEEPFRHAHAAEVKPEPMDAQTMQHQLPPEHVRHTTEPQAWPIYRPRPVRAGSGSDRSGSDHDGSNSSAVSRDQLLLESCWSVGSESWWRDIHIPEVVGLFQQQQVDNGAAKYLATNHGAC